jgi:cell division protein FtsW
MAEHGARAGRLRAVGIPAAQAWDFGFIGAAAALALFGLLAVYTASITQADSHYARPSYFLEHQALYLALGAGLGYLVSQARLDGWGRLAPALLALSVALLVAVLIPGVGREVNGARRWLGLPGFALQPSEFAKLALALFIAARLAAADTRVRMRRATLEIGVALVLVALLMLLEPDYGSAAVLLAMVAVMLFMGGLRLHYFIALGALGAGALALLAVTSPYRMARLTAFLDPWADPFANGFQLTQALIAFGRGGWVGVGLGNSVQKLFYLPEAHTDFVLAIVAEELGLLAVLLVLALYVQLVWCGLSSARRALAAGARFAGLLAYGLTALIGLQAFLNFGVCMGVLPTKGLTLPLLSYGGSSLLATCLALGLLARVEHENRTRSGVMPL